MKTNYKDLIQLILNYDNNQLKNSLSEFDREVFELYKGCIIHIALESGNIEAAKFLILESIKLDKKLNLE